MSENEILKQIDKYIDQAEEMLLNCSSNRENYLIKNYFFLRIRGVMKNYEKVLEVNHFKKTEL